MEKQRKYNIDLLRILACFMVVFLHVSADKWYSVPYTSNEWMVFNIYDCAVRSCVPLFFMMSGMLFFSKESISIKTLYGKHIAKLVLLYMVCALLYAADKLGLDYMLHYFNGREFFDTVMQPKYHLWFLPSMASVYMALPVMHTLRDKEKLLRYILVLFFVFGILRTSLNPFPATEDIAAVMGKFDCIFAYYLGYFILGYVISLNKDRIRLKSRYLLIILAAVIVLTAWGNYLLCVVKDKRVSSLYNNYFISTFVEACIIFLLFLRLPEGGIGIKTGKMIRRISACTLFIYLFHPFVIEHLGIWFGIHTLAGHTVVSVPALAVLVFAICLAIGLAVTKIPYIKKLFT